MINLWDRTFGCGPFLFYSDFALTETETKTKRRDYNYYICTLEFYILVCYNKMTKNFVRGNDVKNLFKLCITLLLAITIIFNAVSCEALENALIDFDGTIIAVCQKRFFRFEIVDYTINNAHSSQHRTIFFSYFILIICSSCVL